MGTDAVGIIGNLGLLADTGFHADLPACFRASHFAAPRQQEKRRGECNIIKLIHILFFLICNRTNR